MKITSLIKNDIKLQYRHGFYYAYLFVSIFYIVILKYIPLSMKDLVSAFVIFTDPAVFGFFFIGAIMLLERGQSTLEGLFITPVSIHEYFCSKLISLTLIAQASSFIIVFFIYGTSFNMLALFIGVLLTSAFFITIGLGMATYAKSFNSFIFQAVMYLSVLFLPVLAYFQLYEHMAFYFIPTTASILLIQSTFISISAWELVYAIGYLLLSIVSVYAWAYRLFKKHIILKIGADQ